MLVTATTASENPALDGKTWIDGQHGTGERVKHLTSLLGAGETLTVTITEGVHAALPPAPAAAPAWPPEWL